MLLSFFETLRRYKLPVSTREILDCLNIMQSGLGRFDLPQFYALARLSLVKDEKLYDRFDQAFAHFLEGVESLPPLYARDDVEAELRQILTSHASLRELDRLLKEYRASIAPDACSEVASGKPREEHQELSRADDGTQAACEKELEKSRMPDESKEGSTDVGASRDSEQLVSEQQASRHQQSADEGGAEGHEGEEGDSGEQGDEGEEGHQGEKGEKGERGERGEGADGAEGFGESETGLMGEKQTFEQAKQRADQLWAQRRFAELDEKRELGTRNLKIALRRVRKLARTGAEFELELNQTIANTARNCGLLDIVEVPERHNSVKVLLFLDIGGSMDEHVLLCEQLFAAARYEFKYLECFYFHNFLYEKVWTDSQREYEHQLTTETLLRKFSKDYKVIFVGDADMARHEITEKGGSVEHYNAIPGEVWFNRLTEHFRRVVWLNPKEQHLWQDSHTAVLIQRLISDEMYPLSVAGIDRAARSLVR